MEKIFSNLVLISDMDDTLLTHDKKISKENLDAIQKFRDLGGIFTIATGRAVPSFIAYLEEMNMTHPVILNNGALIYDSSSDEILWDIFLPQTATEQVIKTIEKFPNVGCEFFVGKDIFIINENQKVIEHHRDESLSIRYREIEDIKEHAYKVLYALEEEDMIPFRNFLATLEADGFYYVNSSKYYCELLPENCSKGHALTIMKDFPDFKDKTICAIGDFYNDIEMLKVADIGIAVQNAPDDVKAHADIVVSTNEEHAISKTVEYLIEKFS